MHGRRFRGSELILGRPDKSNDDDMNVAVEEGDRPRSDMDRAPWIPTEEAKHAAT